MLKYIKSGNTDKIIATTLHLSDICIKMIPKQFPKDYEVLTNFTELGTEENAERNKKYVKKTLIIFKLVAAMETIVYKTICL